MGTDKKYIDSGRYIQFCSIVKATDTRSFTELCLRLTENSQEVFSWVCEHYDISFRAWLDLGR